MLITDVLNLSETVEHDILSARRATKAALQVSHAINQGVKPFCEVEMKPGVNVLAFDPTELGLTKLDPQLERCPILLGMQEESTRGMSGIVATLPLGSLTPQTDRCIGIMGMRDYTLEGARTLVMSTEFVATIRHEFIHLFDNFGGRISLKSIDSLDNAQYYNDTAEFNAFYHDMTDMLTSIASAAEHAESPKDYADLYGFTGDFNKDLRKMCDHDFHTKAFWKWLTDDRRKALLRRIYKLHKHVADLIRQPSS